MLDPRHQRWSRRKTASRMADQSRGSMNRTSLTVKLSCVFLTEPDVVHESYRATLSRRYDGVGVEYRIPHLGVPTADGVLFSETRPHGFESHTSFGQGFLSHAGRGQHWSCCDGRPVLFSGVSQRSGVTVMPLMFREAAYRGCQAAVYYRAGGTLSVMGVIFKWKDCHAAPASDTCMPE